MTSILGLVPGHDRGYLITGLLKFVLRDRRNLRESQRTPLLEVMENVGVNLAQFLPGKSWRASGMFDFIASSLVLAPMIGDCTALDTKYLVDELERNARYVFLAHNPTCVEALLTERCCSYISLIMLLHLVT
jgi:hypothetical protein